MPHDFKHTDDATPNDQPAHDLGGFIEHLREHGLSTEIKRSEVSKKPYEERADAMLLLLSNKGQGIMNIHAMRRASEQFSHADYLQLSYYDRWVKAMIALCIEKEVFSNLEWQAQLDAVKSKARDTKGLDGIPKQARP
ncbi:nitrile hydratase subunit beta [Alphaproteobacteria bacterium]|jgi:hypothetical protein|nr:nitrile hydratase subunit beta [Alphaproteobacteria bacterium]